MGKRIVFFTLLFVFYISFVFMIFFIAGYSNVLDDSQYIKSLKNSRFIKTIMSHIEVSTGVYSLYKIDRQLYFTVISYIKKTIEDTYVKKMIRNWTDFLKGKKSIIYTIDFSKMRSNVFWIISDRINKSKKIPSFLKNKARQFLKKRFKRVPGKINIFKSLKVRKNMIHKINIAGYVFSKFYGLRIFIIILPVFLIILMLLIIVERKQMLYWVSFWGVVLSGTLLLMLSIFGSKSINLVLEVISHHKSMSSHIMKLLSHLLNEIISDVKTFLTIFLLTISIPLIRDVFRVKRVSSEVL